MDEGGHQKRGPVSINVLLATAVKFLSRAAEAESLDDLQKLLTNDIRCIIEFDRCLLVAHLGRKSRFVAANNAPSLDMKSKFNAEVRDLARSLAHQQDLLFIAQGKDLPEALTDRSKGDLGPRVQSFMRLSGCNQVLVVPLVHLKKIYAHLICEFFGENAPKKESVQVLKATAPVLASILGEKWILNEKPRLSSIMAADSLVSSLSPTRVAYLFLVSFIGAVICFVLFLAPFDFMVGGEAEVTPQVKHFAFCKMDGLVEKVLVREGSPVEEGETLAIIDSRELDHQIQTAQREFDILTKEMVILKDGAGEEPAKLAQAELAGLKRRNKWKELAYLESQREFLNISAPATGTAVTKDVDSLVGKRFLAGQPFCEIARHGEVEADIQVPENRVSYVRPGQDVRLFLNTNPTRGYRLKLEEISPKAEAHPRLGNVYRARARFLTAPPREILVGMKGVGKIRAANATLWFVIHQRLKEQWNRLSLHF